jgi:DNA ligase (NAD+)
MNIDGLGIQIVEQLMDSNLVKKIDDLFTLSYPDLVVLDRFQDKSANNLINAINNAKYTTFPRFIFALGISNVGQHISKILDTHCQSSVEKLSILSIEELESIDGIGLIVAQSIIEFFNSPSNRKILNNCLMNGVTIEKTIFKNSSQFKDMIFVITGSFKEYKRTEVKELLEKKGGRVTSTVSSKTSFLIIGDNAGSKLEKARALNIKSINEDQLESFLN